MSSGVWPLKKQANKYENRAKFTRQELEQLNIEAYDLGAAHVMEATALLYGLGKKRLEESKETLERTSYRELSGYADKFSPLQLRRHVTKYEARIATQAAYRIGVDHTLESVGYAYRLGETRLARIRDKLAELQAADLQPLIKTGNIYEARINRDVRRAKNPTKKGAVLDE